MNSSTESETIPFHFLIYWIGQLLSLTGSEITQFAIIWWIAIAYESPLIFALGLFAGNITNIFMMPIIGIITDVQNRKRVLILADFAQALVTLVLIMLFLNNSINLVLLLIILAFRGVFQNIHDNTNGAIVPQIVPKSIYSRLNGMNLLSIGVSNMGGPLIGALLVEIFGVENISTILFIDLISFAFAFLTIVFLKIPLNIRAETISISFKDKFTYGFRFIAKNRIMVMLVSLPTMANFTLTASHIVMPIYMLSENHLNGGAGGLGLAIAVQSFGFLLASTWTSWRKMVDKFYIRDFTSYMLWVVGVGFTAVSLFLNSIPVLLIGQFLTGFWIAYVSTVNATIWQRIVPNQDLGKVAATRRMFVSGSYPIGLLLVGLFTELIDPVIVVSIGCILGFLYLILSFKFSTLKLLDEFIEKTENQISVVSN